jgi:hypothetical protein
MTSEHPRQDSHAALDEAARRAHAASLDRLSPRVQAQLAQRRRAAMKQATAPAPVRAWPMLALGSAAALTLAVGLFVVRSTDDNAPKTAATVATAPTADTDTTAHSATITADTSTTPAPVIASAGTPDATVDSTSIDRASIDSVPADNTVIENDALPEELLAAEFGTADETMGFDALQESPDFYLWLGSEESQADVTESL